jgi:hypothetical protein
MNVKGYRRRSAMEAKRQRGRPATYATTNNTPQIVSRSINQRPNCPLPATNKIVFSANRNTSSDCHASLSLIVSLEAIFTSGHPSSSPPVWHSANGNPSPDAQMTAMLLDWLTHHRETVEPATNPGASSIAPDHPRAAVSRLRGLRSHDQLRPASAHRRAA